MTTCEDDWICIVCLRTLTSDEMSSAVQIELEVDGASTIYFMRHGGCEMTDEARLRLAKAGRQKKGPYR